jgi:Domain of unknown function (DUF5004)
MIENLIKFGKIKLTSMKKISLLLVTIAMVSLWSCGKYEEGPMFSLRSKTGRIAGTWVYDKILQNDVDVTSQSTANSTFEMTIERDGTYKTVYSYTVLGQNFSGEDTGTWEFGDNETLSVTSDNGGGTNSTTIIRLTNSEFWTRETDSSTGDVTEVHYKSK